MIIILKSLETVDTRAPYFRLERDTKRFVHDRVIISNGVSVYRTIVEQLNFELPRVKYTNGFRAWRPKHAAGAFVRQRSEKINPCAPRCRRGRARITETSFRPAAKTHRAYYYCCILYTCTPSRGDYIHRVANVATAYTAVTHNALTIYTRGVFTSV